MTDDDLHRLLQETAREAAREAVRETLLALGLDADHPHDMQADLVFLRRHRQISERIGIGLRLALVSAFVSGAAAMLWLGLRMALKGDG